MIALALLALAVASVEPPLSSYPQPPNRFRVDNTALVTFAKPELVQELCGRRHNTELIGCADALPPSMRVPNPCHYPEQSFALIVCHELGHANGWTYEHED